MQQHEWRKDQPDTVLTKEFLEILDLIEYTKQNVFITGVAGTGKSKLLTLLQLNTKKNFVVLAPTGVSALNVGGATIHSFFRLPIGLLKDEDENIKYNRRRVELYSKLDLVVIDEISMVRADILDAIDYTLRLHRKSIAPFGGVQMLFFGDIMQLPPVVAGRNMQEYFEDNYGSPYFFDAHVYKQTHFVKTELTHVFRQKDKSFIDLLNKIRLNQIDSDVLNILNSRYRGIDNISEDNVLTLCTTNKLSSEINDTKMAALNSKLYTYHADIQGDFDSKYYPTDSELSLKVGAQVMMLKNDPGQRWVNGTIGTIQELSDECVVMSTDNHTYEVPKATWELNEYIYDREQKKIEAKVIGSFTQYPMKLAWAITIHKSQGQTYERVKINLGRGAFAHGQAYVAFSRCQSLEGIVLLTKITRRDIFVDPVVSNFVRAQE